MMRQTRSVLHVLTACYSVAKAVDESRLGQRQPLRESISPIASCAIVFQTSSVSSQRRPSVAPPPAIQRARNHRMRSNSTHQNCTSLY